ncbi:non-ribosomal peptide synthetase [Streptomyces alkaliphilus]|uniref:non-ribosomal peptide synthetase n=1 Tax=Streptomyces alkaliphilus TaxID=1472722 RepID=UPI00117CC90A|nr:non-ribosomal peptide synthetase [Streptomyces alkaliphilus]MQS05664.1 amino acid adenylation domain-containing protein [Streptomyces alkaliphilus]
MTGDGGVSHAATAASPDEREVWLAAERDRDSAAYHIPVAFHRDGRVDRERLRLALDALQTRHRGLRARFVADRDTLLREVTAAAPISLVHQERPDAFDLDDATAWAEAFARLRLDPGVAPLARVGVRQYTDRALVVLVFHHLITDAWSLDPLLADLLNLYHGETSSDAPDVGDASEGRTERPPDPQSAAREAAYWTELLGDAPPCLSPASDFLPAEAPVRSRFVGTLVETDVLETLRRADEMAPASTAVVAFSVWTALLHLWSGENEGLSGMTFAGRLDPASHPDLVLRARVLPVRTKLSVDTPMVDFIAANRRQIVESLVHSDVAADVVRMELRKAGPGTLEAAFTYIRSTASGRLAGHGWESIDVPVAAAKTPLGLAVTERAGYVDIQLDYDTNRYTDAAAQSMLDQFAEALRRLAGCVDRSAFTAADLLPAYERAALETTARHQAAYEPLVPSPVDLVRERARMSPDGDAIRYRARRVSYGALIGDVDVIAHGLRAAGVVRGELVGVMLPRGVDAVSAILAVVAAGGAYLPLDPEFPIAQVRAILRHAGVRRVIVDEDARADLRVERVTVAALRDSGRGCADHHDHEPAGSSRDLFHCIYTSGSTGEPKGVMLDRRGFMRLLGVPGFVPLGPGDTMTHLSPLNFDASTFEIWASLTQGACLGIIDKAELLDPHTMADAMLRLGVSASIMTSPLFNHLVDEAPRALSAMNWIYIGGESVSPEHVRGALRWVGPGVLLHSYGPAENSFTTHFRPIEAVARGSRTIPLGTEVPFTHAYVVFEGTTRPVPVGVPGELLVGGPGISWGYLGQPRLTARKFIPDPFTGIPGARLYRSGDRVRWTPGGEIEFIGRIDGQVKVRGNRVELAGVEAVLRGALGVSTACVLQVEDGVRGKELVAFVVPTSSDALANARDHASRQLPPFAQPRRYIEVAHIPRKANNKIDQAALRRLAVTDPPLSHGESHRPAASTVPGDAAPRPSTSGEIGDVEELVAGCWRTLLGHSDFEGRNFFDAGGNSLLLFRLSELLREASGVALPVVELLRHTSVRAQAARLRESGAAPAVRAVAAGTPRLPGGDERSRRPGPGTSGAVADSAVAIIGLGCTLPKAHDAWAFWQLLGSGQTALSGTGPAEPGADGRRVVDRWGRIDLPALDLEPYGLSPDENASLDPQHGIFMRDVLAALEDAGYEAEGIAHRTAIFAGSARRTAPQHPANSAAGRFVAALAHSSAFLATRIAYGLGFRGEAVMLDTACSTSLVAVHAARASLLSGSCDYALAGGVSVQESDMSGYVYEPGLIYSPTGTCLPFDRHADGTVGGDGSGVVLMKRLADAIRDGDPVYAVIRGSAVNNDGHDKAGYTAPNHDGQVQVIRSALDSAGLSAGDVSYIEAHGTGTLLGDRVEARALTEALGTGPVCHVGSVKATVGHLNTAAGVVGLIKTALAIQHGVIPATPGVTSAIDEFAGASSRFRPVGTAIPWDAPAPVAGVSSFGIGGTNAHVIVTKE